MRRARGYAVIVDPNAPLRECDTFTCCHCQRVVFIRPFSDASDAGGFCRLCFKHICGPCADTGTCTPFEKRLEEMEGRRQFLTSVVP